MKIPEYKSLQEKKEAFGDNYQRISTITELKPFLENCKSFKDYIFRGNCEAKYKNYTSAQRRYFVNDLSVAKVDIEELIKKQIDIIKEEHKNLIDDYYNSLGIKTIDLLYLGIAQHYGGISPLLDFTTDLKTALFFLADSAEFPNLGTDDIENYASLYYVPSLEIQQIRIETFFSDLASGIKNMLLRIAYLPFPQPENKKNINENVSLKLIEKIKNKPTLIPSKKESSSFQDNNSKIYFTIANLNLIAQKGCFVYYLPTEQTSPFEKPLHCVDVHKSLIPYISEYIGLKKSDIYPDYYDIVKNAYSKAIRSIMSEKDETGLEI